MNKETKKEQTSTYLFPFQIHDVRLYDVNITRCDSENEDDRESSGATIMLLHGNESIDNEEFGILLTFQSDFPQDDKPVCNIQISIEGLFHSIVDKDTIKEEVLNKFRDSDAIVILWPYLRQILHDITERMKLGIPPIPVIDPRALLKDYEPNDKD